VRERDVTVAAGGRPAPTAAAPQAPAHTANCGPDTMEEPAPPPPTDLQRDVAAGVEAGARKVPPRRRVLAPPARRGTSLVVVGGFLHLAGQLHRGRDRACRTGNGGGGRSGGENVGTTVA
jgi:hypothetical protein